MAWNRPSESQTRAGSSGGRRPRTRLRGLVAAAVVVTGAVVAWFALTSGPADRRPRQRAGAGRRIPEAAPAKAKPAQAAELKVPKASGRRIEERAGVAAPRPLEELEGALTNRPPKKAAPFRNAAEKLIALATPSAPGVDVPPLPDLSGVGLEADVAAAEKHVIAAEEGDSEEVLSRKLAVAEAKEQFLELRQKEGCSFVEYLNALRDQANLDADFLREAHAMLDGLYHDEAVTDADYEEYRRQVNVKLRERGLPEID